MNTLPIPRTKTGRVKRSSKYNPRRHAAIVLSLRHGCTRRAAAEAAGINVSTFGKWMEQFSAFNSDVIKAEAEWEQEVVHAIQLAATPHTVRRVKTLTVNGEVAREEVTETTEHSWEAAAWLLARRRSADYGKQAEAALPVVNVNVALEPALLKIYGNQAQLPASSPSNVIEGEIVEGADTEEEQD